MAHCQKKGLAGEERWQERLYALPLLLLILPLRWRIGKPRMVSWFEGGYDVRQVGRGNGKVQGLRGYTDRSGCSRCDERRLGLEGHHRHGRKQGVAS